MPLAFLSVKASDDGRILAISIAALDGGSGPHTLKTWGEDAYSERRMLTDFCRAYAFWEKRWLMIPVCLSTEKTLGPLWKRSMAHGLLEFGADPWGAKPVLDLHPVLCLLNADAQAREEKDDGGRMQHNAVPPMFYGASLARFTGTMQTADSIGALVKAGMHKAADKALADEAEAFVKLWGVLKAEAPKWWKETLSGKVVA